MDACSAVLVHYLKLKLFPIKKNRSFNHNNLIRLTNDKTFCLYLAWQMTVTLRDDFWINNLPVINKEKWNNFL